MSRLQSSKALELSGLGSQETKTDFPEYTTIELEGSGIHSPGYAKICTDEGRAWKTGQFKRFPFLSACCLLGVVGICISLVCILHYSDGQDYDTWCVYNGDYPGLRKPGSEGGFLIKPRRINFSMTVNIWISFLVFVAGKLLAFAFIESVTVNWWRSAQKGESLKRLHLNYEAGRSVSAVALNLKWFNWIFFCSVVYTLFGVAGPLLQQSSTIRTNAGGYVNATKHEYPDIQRNGTSFHTYLATRFPRIPGTSTSVLADRAWSSWERSATFLSNVTNCRPTGENRPFSQCAGLFPTIGFDIACTPESDTEESVSGPTSSNRVFEISLNHDNTFWDLDINFLWRGQTDYDPEEGCSDIVILQQTCRLRPALVYMPISFDLANAHSIQWAEKFTSYIDTPPGSPALLAIMDDDIVTLFNRLYKGFFPDLPNITDFHDNGYNLAHARLLPNEVSIPEDWESNYFTGYYDVDSELYVDPLIKLLEKPEHAEEVMGSLYATFNRTLSVSLDAVHNPESSKSTLISSGPRNPPFSLSPHASEEVPCGIPDFQSPTSEAWRLIRKLTLRYSVAAAKSAAVLKHDPDSISVVSSMGMSHPEFPDSYISTRNVYRSNYPLLASGISLMLVAVACTASLFWGFWGLGREVSLSPLEISRAMQIPDEAGNPLMHGEATNATIGELVDRLGHIEVKYGEVSATALGIGLRDEVLTPRNGQKYR